MMYYVEGYFFYFGMLAAVQYLLVGVAGMESRNHIGKEKGNKFLWVLPRGTHHVTFTTVVSLLFTEVFVIVGTVALMVGEIPWQFIVAVMVFVFCGFIYACAKAAIINKKIAETPSKSFMERMENTEKPLKIRLYGSGLKGFTYGIILETCLLFIMNIIWLLRNPSPFYPFIKFLEWLAITGAEAGMGIRFWMQEKGFCQILTVEGRQVVFKDGWGRCRQFEISDLCWMETPAGGIRIWYGKKEQVADYGIFSHGAEEFCNVVREVPWVRLGEPPVDKE